MALLRPAEVGLPLGFPSRPPLVRALDVFVGYLMLDALVSNQDRHHENWGYVVTPEANIHLAPTYDHASSLGRNETDAARLDRLTTKDTGRSVERYVERAKSAFFPASGGDRVMTTLAAFEEAARLRPEAGRYWLGRLEDCSEVEIEAIFSRIPPEVISQPAARFAVRMLCINRSRLLRIVSP